MLQAAAIMLYTQVCSWEQGEVGISVVCVARAFGMYSNRAITGDVSLSPLKCGSARPRHAQPRAVPPVHEAIAVSSVPATSRACTHLPRCQARAVRGER